MKFIESHYEEHYGTMQSIVSIEHLGKIFTAEAWLHPDDKDKASEFVGCAYAESRAVVKALKYERKLLKEEAEICRKFIKSCSCHKTWDPESPTAKAAYHQLNLKIKKVNDITDEINKKLTSLDKAMWQRDVTLRAFERNKQKKLNSTSKN